jgi:hypothetical protein
MAEPNTSATIRALADLADLSAKQLEEGQSIDDVIALLRKAATAVRSALDTDEQEDDFTPLDLERELNDVEDISA